MKFLPLLTAVAIGTASANTAPITTERTTMLRGKKVIHRRTVFPSHTEEGLKPDNRNMPDQLVDTPIKLRGASSNGEQKQGGDAQRQETSKESHKALRQEHHREGHHGHRSDGHLGHHQTHDQHFENHHEYEQHHHPHQDHHHHHRRPHHHTTKQSQPEKEAEKPKKKSEDNKKRQQQNASTYALPTGLAEHFNETLFDELHAAPFDIFEEALGHELDEDDSFPVFSVPAWQNAPGLYSAFSKHAEPLIFENSQFLLKWEDIEGASTVSSTPLQEYIANNNFHSSLIIGKSYKDNKKTVAFLGLVVSYFQYGSQKNVMVPFGRLEDFFDDASEQHLSDPETKHLEAEALQEMLGQKKTNSSDLYHPTFLEHHSQDRKEQLEDIEIIHFQKLYKLLIRRSFLFSFGYADCLLAEPEYLRECLDDTFYSVVKMETSVRGALEDQIIHQLAEINENSHSKIAEACISFEGGIIGMGGCTDTNDLTAYASAFGSL